MSTLQNSIKVLGHVISYKEVKMDEEKIQAIKEIQAPENIKQLQRFLGICNYYRKFIKNFAEIASPIYNLLKKDNVWEWKQEQKFAFELLKMLCIILICFVILYT